MAHIVNQGTVTNLPGRDANIANQYNYYGDKLDPLLRLAAAPQAEFNAFGKDYDPQCLQNTRVEVLRQIRAWADGDDRRYIFWLRGWAGTGKSTIARTIAREYHDKGCFMASFFFARGDADVSHAEKFVGTIASQLAQRCIAFRSLLVKAISNDSGITGRTLKDQWSELVLQPLLKLETGSFQGPLLIVIDALDECGKESDVRLVLQLLSDFRHLSQLHSRVFITSRPDTSVRHGFSVVPDQDHQEFVLHDISRPIVDDDIFIYLQHKLADIRHKRQLGQEWPGEEATRNLVRKAAGLFIWAATASRFIDGGGRLANKRLSLVLQANVPTAKPEEELDKIYTMVLKNSVGEELDQQEKQELYCLLRETLGTIVILFSHLPPGSLAKLLHINEGDIEQTLVEFHSILDISKDPNQPVRLHHPSFRDFLLDKNRCVDPNFWVDEKRAHQQLANGCILVMTSSLKQNICGADASDTHVTDRTSNQLDQYLLPELQYACLYWIQHLQKSGAQFSDNDQVHSFLKEHFLHWLEALSWMRKVSEGVHAISSLELIAQTHDCPRLYEFVHDMMRFTLYSRPGLEQTPLQIYCGALIHAPEKSMVRQQFADRLPRWVRRVSEGPKVWNALLQQLEGHSGFIIAVAFSRDGKLLASASVDNTVRLWEAATGGAMRTIKVKNVASVAFSSDSVLLASASWDKTVRLWDVTTGAMLRTLEGHLDWVMSVAFSPTNMLLASGSVDKRVRLWNAVTGEALMTLEDHQDSVYAIAFSPDGKLLASASGDRTVKMWVVSTGLLQQTLKTYSRNKSLAFSPNNKLLASNWKDNAVMMWDTDTGEPLRLLQGHSDVVRAVTFSPDQKLLASASYDKTIRLWDADSGAELQTFKHSYSVDDIAFSVDSKRLASASSNWSIWLWDLGPGATPQPPKNHLDAVDVVAFSPDGKLLASGSSDKTVKLWDAATGMALHKFEGHSRSVHTIAFSPDGKMLASVSHKTVALWNTATGARIATLSGHSKEVKAIAFSPDGELLASSSADETTRIWHMITGATLNILGNHHGPVDTVAFSPDGKKVADASDKMITLWDTATGEMCDMFYTQSHIQDLSFSPDSEQVACALSNNMVMIWYTATGHLSQTLCNHLAAVMAVAFSPGGKHLASASHDGVVILWDAATGAMIQQIQVNVVIRRLSFSRCGSHLETNRGSLDITSLSPRTLPSRPLSSTSIFVREPWILRGMKNLLWLPSDYWPHCVDVHGSVVALGDGSGRLSILEFS